MNPELIERPYEVAYYKSLEVERRIVPFFVAVILLTVGVVLGVTWREVFELFF